MRDDEVIKMLGAPIWRNKGWEYFDKEKGLIKFDSIYIYSFAEAQGDSYYRKQIYTKDHKVVEIYDKCLCYE
jgi:hypothetical protein